MKLPGIEASWKAAAGSSWVWDQSWLHNKTMFQNSAPDGTNHQVWQPESNQTEKAKNQPCKFSSDLRESLIQPYIHMCTHTHTHQKKVIKEIIQKLRRWKVSPDSANTETIQAKHNNLTAKTYWPNFRILSAATRVTCPPMAVMEEQGALWWSILTRLNSGHMSSCFPFDPSLGRDSCLPDFFLPVQWLHPIRTKPKTWRNLFLAHTHIHWGISVQSTGCRVVHSWQGPAALFGVHSLTPTDNYWAQRPDNLRTWNYQGKIFKGKKK